MSDINRIKKSVLWSAIDKVASSGMQLILNLILARLIIPEEYALIAMISIFIAVGQTFIDSGFSQSLIHKQDRTETDFSTVFIFNIVVAVVIYLIIFLLAPFIAYFYNNSIFIPLTRVVALNLLISSLAIVQRAILIIKTDFKTQAIVSIIAILISGVTGVYLAYNGFGVWAMVAQTLLNQLIAAILLWCIVHWLPKKDFSVSSFRQLFSYGSKLLVSRLINTVCQNFHSIIIGKFYSRSSVAYFTNANQISLYSACYLNDIIQRALFPIQCEMQSDISSSKDFFYKMLRLSSYIIFPLMVAIIVLSEPFVMTILTPEWKGMIVLMQIIAFAYMWYPLMSSNQMFNVLGRTDLYLRTEIIKKIFFVLIVIITVSYGVEAMCWGIAVYNLIEIIITIFILKQIFPITFKEIILNIIPAIFLSLGMALSIYMSNMFLQSSVLKLFVGIFIAFISYFSLSVLFKSRDLQDILKIVKNKRK